MPESHHYGAKSLDRLADAHEQLRRLFLRVGPRFPNTILETKRSLEQQKANVAKGVSKTMDSRHLDEPHANAVDAAPDPLEWPSIAKVRGSLQELVTELSENPSFGAGGGVEELLKLVDEYALDLARWYYFGGYVCGVADEIGVPIRWGGDWNGNRKVDDQSFHDLPHFERRR